MNQGADQFRLAITAFDDPQTAWGTIRALLANGFDIEQFCLVALARSLERVVGDDSCRFRALVEQVEDWPSIGGEKTNDGHQIVATAGPLIRSVLPALGDESEAHAHITPEHRLELEAQARQGAIVLIVESSNPAQQRLSTRTLLDQSSRSVKTYEFAVASSDGQPRRG